MHIAPFEFPSIVNVAQGVEPPEVVSVVVSLAVVDSQIVPTNFKHFLGSQN